MTAPANPLPHVNKLVLAVHGIGDQTRNSTILSTAAQFTRHFGYRALLPLGGFYDTLQHGQPPFVITDTAPANPGPLNRRRISPAGRSESVIRPSSRSGRRPTTAR